MTGPVVLDTYLGPVPATARPTYAVQVTAAAAVTDPHGPWQRERSTPAVP